MHKRNEKPVALLVNPPVYDFSLYDLFHRPLGLMRIGRWLEEAGYEVSVVDALDVDDRRSTVALGKVKRKQNGTGHFFKQPARFPASGSVDRGTVDNCTANHATAAHRPTDRSPGCSHPPVKRNFSRFGILAESFSERLGALKPDIVLITSGMTYWYPGVVEAVRTVRALHPAVPVIAGGVYATLLPDHCRRTAGPDYLITGPPWMELRRILSSINLPVPEAPPDGRVLLDHGIWRGAGVLKLNEGCPLRCDYCASSILHPVFEAGSGTGLLRILRELVESCGIGSFAFYDDALLHRKEESFIPFLESVIESGLDLAFYLPNAIHLSLLDFNTASLMRRAGFREIRVGYESSSPVFHACHDEKVKRGDFYDTIATVLEAGFDKSKIIAYVLAGLPRQRAAEVEDSVRYVSSFGVRASVAEYSPVPGTGLWEESVEASPFPIEEEPLYQNNSIIPLQWDGFTAADLQRIKDLSRELVAG